MWICIHKIKVYEKVSNGILGQEKKMPPFYPVRFFGLAINYFDIRQVNRRKAILTMCVYTEVPQKIWHSKKGQIIKTYIVCCTTE